MDKLSLRLSEEEKALLREQAEGAGVSVSELIRDRLFPRNISGTPATFGQVAELSRRVAALSEVLEELRLQNEKAALLAPENLPVPGHDPDAGSELRLEKMERQLAALSEDLAELKELLQGQKSAPSGWLSLLSRR